MFQELFPILGSDDIETALGFYRDLLGLEVTYRFPDEGEPQYVGLRLGSSQLGIGATPEAVRATRTGSATPMELVADTSGESRFSLWLYVDDCDAAVEHLRHHGVRVLQEPEDQPWGERTATVSDPDGNRVIIGSRPAD